MAREAQVQLYTFWFYAAFAALVAHRAPFLAQPAIVPWVRGKRAIQARRPGATGQDDHRGISRALGAGCELDQRCTNATVGILAKHGGCGFDR